MNERKLKATLKRHPRCGSRPLVVQPLVEPIGYLAYMAKPNFSRRTSYIDGKGRRNTRIEPLSILEELELARWLCRYRVEQRVFSIGNLNGFMS
ncbi:hypothetical protein P2H44_07530 [Albimonas sp. CAU 1670]|uniref:hypothetical protein n=1 Tax=Albimonas sp. CAU 1670 TaxID=3032599 RepID=UPI0023DA49AF|nr:hypothetical protein [Albimonas sp. CAU 1670]MDF2232403.1 hypothetical protein [Albimonas sp. CAU 1670]